MNTGLLLGESDTNRVKYYGISQGNYVLIQKVINQFK